MSKSLQERLNSLERKYKNLCCKITSTVPEVQGCITFTDITWEEFIAAIDNGTIADCYYNITNRPNSGENPLYVLVEKGLPNFDNEVRRGEQALASFCIGDATEGNGCYNIYATSTYTFDLTPWTTCAIRLQCDVSSPLDIQVGTVLYYENEVGDSGTVTVIGIDDKGEYFFIDDCFPKSEKPFYIGLDGIEYPCTFNQVQSLTVNPSKKCIQGVERLQVGSLICSNSGQAVVTELTETSISFEPTSGSWEGISVFWICGDNATGCHTYIIPPIVITSTPLNSEPICFSNSVLEYGAYSNQMLLASDGNLYGVLGRDGQLITIDPVTDLVTILVESKLEGAYSSLVEVSGILYGTASDSGDGYGSIWSYEIASQLFTTLYEFDNVNDGGYPYTGLCNVGGVLYGTCENGAWEDVGTLFSWNIATSTFSVLEEMKNSNISYPQGTLLEVAPNKLWGTSYRGGANDEGTVFEYNITTGTLSIILDLSGVDFGVAASGGVFKASNGNVYLQTYEKGPLNHGTIIKIENVGTTNDSSVVFNFIQSLGSGSDAVIPVEIGGFLYGVTSQGGVDKFGTLWSLDLVSEDFTLLYEFNLNSDRYPYTSLCVVGTNLYGMTDGWGAEASLFRGSIYKFDTLTNEYTLITPLNTIIGDPNQIALITCAAIDNPAYTCTVVDGCVYVTGSGYAEDNGQVLDVRTLYTFSYTPDGDDPIAGQQILMDGDIVGTIIDVDTVSGTMRVEWTYIGSPSILGLPVSYEENTTGNTGTITNYFGEQVVYTSTPFTGGDPFPHNMPCYYNSKADIIVDYPMSQAFTKAEIQKFIEDKTLVPGAFYFIKGLDITLYGGTTCILQADTPNKFKMRGSGLFHTPDYDAFEVYSPSDGYVVGTKVIWGGQVWTCIADVDINAVDNQFSLNSEYFTNGASSCIVYVDPFSLTGGTFNIGDEVDFILGYPTNAFITDLYISSTGNISYLVLSLPLIGTNYESITITNLTTGASIDTVSSGHNSTVSIPDYTAYNEQWDEITYDQDNDFITSRKDVASNYVEQSFTNYNDFDNFEYRSIKAFKWGFNAFQFDGDVFAVGSNTIINSVAAIINNDSYIFYDNTMTNTSIYDYSVVYNTVQNLIIKSSSIYSCSGSVLFYINLESSFLASFTGSAESLVSYNSYVVFNGSTCPSTIYAVKFNNTFVSANIDSATVIYSSYSKEVYTNASGLAKIFYLDGSGTISLVNINA